MAVVIKAGVLYKEGQYFGANTKLSSELFDTGDMKEIIFAWLTPSSDSGVGSPSAVASIQEAQFAPATTAVRGVAFFYEHGNIRKRYFISAESNDLIAALQSTDYHEYVAISPISPYTVVV